MNVLIFPAGTEIGREIWQALRYSKDVTLFTAGEKYENHALYYCESYDYLPSVNNAGWVNVLEEYIHAHQIDYIFPAHDEVLIALAAHRQHLSATVLAPATELCHLLRSKRATYQTLADIISVPSQYDAAAKITSWPVFIKPDRGQGAQGACRIHSSAELSVALSQLSDPIICEYLPGEEFTVDCFSDRDRGLLFCQARTRERVRSGIAMASALVCQDEFALLAEKISRRLGIYGAWFFQLKRNQQGELTLLEVAPRIAGTMALNRARGINFPLLTLYESRRMNISLQPLKLQLKISRGLVNRYKSDVDYQSVYIDFDDTIIVRGRVCLPVITFIYQCLNEGVSLHLITRHKGNIQMALKKWRLENIFNSVIHLTHAERKSDYIRDENSIFIDDSFSERMDVSHRCGIPTFDLSMIEMLLTE